MVTLGFTKEELHIFRRLTTPEKIQDFLETIPINFEEKGNTLLSPRRVLRENKAHCFEGALLAASALAVHGERPIIMDLRTAEGDEDHVVALFQRFGCYGAITKTNHAVLRYREPIYKTLRELVLSFFHEYFLDDGRKMLREYSAPLDLSAKRFTGWAIAEDEPWYINDALDGGRFFPLLTDSQVKVLRPADPIEIKAGKLTEWGHMCH
ncbi:MAG: hypothetical protein COV91_01445 [Candidatus Taylorbacteria bacterium CG11_big_fil_rev_8_21_14_0_20_46_11]|uniref:Transglutaminase-like domain-containing protein n=1 Tax=Candidatus Taylorbacteria bacterium CG11_big_fil_rev_8_21_14_0_20_46_11 TaxID=1975025 RepID=A0A2H0KCH0_9BACT|nr:MAG: hypothetical protein COV91_01445 [Candidatus Taylorbacteria bacterium CG11_big_fil_rev_8_21_14_0_20_46_11]